MTFLSRHASTNELLSFLEYAHLPEHLAKISRPLNEVAHTLVLALPDGPELSAGLRKLVEAKDCFVRQAVKAARA